MTVKDPAAIKRDLFVSGFGAILTSLCGWLLWGSPLGDAWVNASYDYLFRFSTRGVTNEVVLILMDNEAYDHFHQNRGQPWSRMLHAELLRKLAADGSALVVLDTFLRQPRSAEEDQALAEALKEQRAVALMAEQARVTHITLAGARATLPCEPFLSAAGGHWGVAGLDPDLDGVVRRHWPFPAPGPYPSLPRTAALLAGAPPGGGEGERWLRYYGQNGAWLELSYRFALASPKEFFRDKIVFIGCRPKTTVADGEPDEFATPYTRWTGENVGGVEIQIVAFLNLMNGDWLRRPAAWVEACLLLVSGLAFGAGLCQLRRGAACVLGLTGGLLVMVGAAWWSHQTNYWFPWLVVSGGEVPLALGWALLRLGQGGESIGIQKKAAVGNTPADVTGGVTKHAEVDVPPETPDYELVNPPFGHGAYGKVWLVRNAVGEWQALKAVYRAKFDDAGPYEREFSGIKRYKPISDKHPGLLRVDFVSRKRPESFYYVMELGDPLLPGWERDPSTYRPRDLASERGRRPGRRLPINECVRIGACAGVGFSSPARFDAPGHQTPEHYLRSGTTEAGGRGAHLGDRRARWNGNVRRHPGVPAAATRTPRHSPSRRVCAGHGALCALHRAESGCVSRDFRHAGRGRQFDSLSRVERGDSARLSTRALGAIRGCQRTSEGLGTPPSHNGGLRTRAAARPPGRPAPGSIG